MQSLAAEIAGLERTLADPGLFARDAAGFEATAARLAAARHELSEAEESWLELELLREEIEGPGA
jgi:ATP-binding cassette subfamily F protein uup